MLRCAARAERSHGCSRRKQNWRPVTSGIRFGERTANRPHVANLRIGDAGSAVAKDGNSRGFRRGGDLRVPCHGADAQSPVAANVGGFGNEVEIDQMTRGRKTKLHQRDEALAAGEELSVVAQLAQLRNRFRIGCCAVIREGPRIHPHPMPGSRNVAGCPEFLCRERLPQIEAFCWRDAKRESGLRQFFVLELLGASRLSKS